MCEITIKVGCPHCHSPKVIKNGSKVGGPQNFLCKSCKKQFINNYRDKGADPRVKHLITSMLLRNCGIRDIAVILRACCKTVLGVLIRQGNLCRITPKKTHYQSVQIDGHWSCVGHKKKGKRWLIYAYAPETGGVLAHVIGKRDTATVKKMYQLLKNIKIDEFCTDQWKAFAHVFKKENHRSGKDLTRHIEGVNNGLRARNRRFVRKSTCFSKKDENHEAAIKIMFQQRNYAHHTF